MPGSKGAPAGAVATTKAKARKAVAAATKVAAKDGINGARHPGSTQRLPTLTQQQVLLWVLLMTPGEIGAMGLRVPSPRPSRL